MSAANRRRMNGHHAKEAPAVGLTAQEERGRPATQQVPPQVRLRRGQVEGRAVAQRRRHEPAQPQVSTERRKRDTDRQGHEAPWLGVGLGLGLGLANPDLNPNPNPSPSPGPSQATGQVEW